MSALGSLYFKLETLETLVSTIKTKGDKGLEITFSINDESNQYGQNVSSYVSQTKEQREAGKAKYYTANGSIFWHNGKIEKGVKSDQQTSTPTPPVDISSGSDDPLPF